MYAALVRSIVDRGTVGDAEAAAVVGLDPVAAPAAVVDGGVGSTIPLSFMHATYAGLFNRPPAPPPPPKPPVGNLSLQMAAAAVYFA